MSFSFPESSLRASSPIWASEVRSENAGVNGEGPRLLSRASRVPLARLFFKIPESSCVDSNCVSCDLSRLCAVVSFSAPFTRFVGGKDVYFPYLTDVLKLSHYYVLDRRFIVGTNQGD